MKRLVILAALATMVMACEKYTSDRPASSGEDTVNKNESCFMKVEWEDGFKIEVGIDMDNAVVISANREGLLSLARQLTALADESVGSHIHYDDYNSLEEGSVEMIIQKG